MPYRRQSEYKNCSEFYWLGFLSYLTCKVISKCWFIKCSVSMCSHSCKCWLYHLIIPMPQNRRQRPCPCCGKAHRNNRSRPRPSTHGAAHKVVDTGGVKRGNLADFSTNWAVHRWWREVGRWWGQIVLHRRKSNVKCPSDLMQPDNMERHNFHKHILGRDACHSLGRDAHIDLLQACLMPMWASFDPSPVCCYVCSFLLDWNIGHLKGIYTEF
jgi:hypothetical protein